MGAHVLEQSRLAGVEQARRRRHDLRLSQVHAGPLPRGRPLERLPRGDQRAVRRRQEGAARRRAGLPRAVRARTRSTCCRRTSTARATTSTSTNSHVIPALIRKMLDGARTEVVLWGDGSPTREFLYVEDAAEAFVLAAERYDGAEPVNLGTGAEISIRELAELVAEADRLRGRDRAGTRRCRTASRAARSTPRARASSSASRPARRCATGLARTIAWYRESKAVHAVG